MTLTYGVLYDFYDMLVDDFLRDGRSSVIYRYYYDEVFGPDAMAARPSDKKTTKTKKASADYLYDHYRLGASPSKEKLYHFVIDLLGGMTQRTELYEHPNKALDKQQDMREIIDAVKPFIKTGKEKLPKQGEEYRLSKTELNRMIKDSIGLIGKNDKCISRKPVDKLVEHVRDRVIIKAFDDNLFTAGYRMVSADELKEGSDDYLYERPGESKKKEARRTVRAEGKGRAVGKTDKTLGLIARYYAKFGRLPFREADIISVEYRKIIEKFRQYLISVVSANGKRGENEDEGLSVVIASDAFTGCSLQIIGSCYYPSGIRKKFRDPVAYAWLDRITENGIYSYETYGTERDDVWISEDIDEAVLNYMLTIEARKVEIIENNSLLFEDDPSLHYSHVPPEYRRFFEEESEKAEEELEADTIKHISGLYDDEEDDVNFIPKFETHK